MRALRIDVQMCEYADVRIENDVQMCEYADVRIEKMCRFVNIQMCG